MAGWIDLGRGRAGCGGSDLIEQDGSFVRGALFSFLGWGAEDWLTWTGMKELDGWLVVSSRFLFLFLFFFVVVVVVV